MTHEAKKPEKYKYKIGVRVRAMVWPEIVYADNLPNAISEVTRRLLADEPELSHWQTRLISEIELSTGKVLRRGDGRFER